MTYKTQNTGFSNFGRRLLTVGVGLAVLSSLAVTGASAQSASSDNNPNALALASTPIAAPFQMASASDSLIRTSLRAYKKGQVDKSIRLSKAALKNGLSKSRRAVAYNNLCAAYGTLGEIEAAVKACETAISLRPGFEPARANLTLLAAQ